MKRLILLRHAKSGWDDPALGDFERPLNKRGRHNAPLMGRHLADRQSFPQQIVSSPARRAVDTARLVAKEIGYDKHGINYEPHIYAADAMILLELVRSFDDVLSEVLLVGHNPDLTDLANVLSSDGRIDNIVTCGMVCLDFPVDTWQAISRLSGAMVFYDYPKKTA